MLDRALIGRKSEPVRHEVERGELRRFAEALGDPNPVYVDEAAARAAGYSSIVAPPTYAAALAANEKFRHSLDLGTKALLHVDQQLEFARPLVAGDSISITTRVADVQERAGTAGPMEILVLEDEAHDLQGQLVFKARSTLVIRSR